MYVNRAATRFTDPFVSSKDCPPSVQDYARLRNSGVVQVPVQDINRALTPPPEMTGIHSTRPSFHAGDHTQQHVDYVRGKPAYRAPVAAPQSLESTSDYSRNAPVKVYSSSRASPSRHAPVGLAANPAQQRRASQHHNAIATNFQIPRSVNDSGGSLSELAAQVSGS